MALPKDPDTGLFPELIEPPFVRAEELAELCDAVRDAFPEFRALVEAARDGGLVLGYVFETKPFDALHEEFKPHTIAKVTKASPLWRSWTGLDAIVSFRRDFWTPFTGEQRRAICYHELRHLDPTQDDDGHWELALREHDLEEFAGVMRHFGPIIPGRKPFLDAAMAWMAEQERPEPTPLRSVEDIAADIATMPAHDQAVIGAAMDFRRSIERSGLDVTVAVDGHEPVTIRGKGKARP